MKWNLIKKLKGLSEESFAYASGGMFLALDIFLDKVLKEEFGKFSLYISFTLFTYGLLIFITSKLKILWQTWFGKSLISGLMFIVSATCFSFAGVFINGVLKVPSEPFTHTLSIVALLISPVVVALLIGFTMVFVIPLSFFLIFKVNEKPSIKLVLMFWKTTSIPDNQIGLGISRVIGVIILFSICINFSSNNSWYTNPIGKFTAWFAYNFETEKYSHCMINGNERLAYLNKDDIIIAKEDNGELVFRSGRCIRKFNHQQPDTPLP